MVDPSELAIIPVYGFDSATYEHAVNDYQTERDTYIEYEIRRDGFYREHPGFGSPANILDRDEESFEHHLPDRADFGMEHSVLTGLLDKVGSEGKHPAIATALFRAGIAEPRAWPEHLYGPNRYNISPDDWNSHLFAVYLHDQKLDRLHATEPDVLVTIQGKDRLPFKGYESVAIDTWVNFDTVGLRQIDVAAIGREVLLRGITSEVDSHLATVERDTKVLQLENSERIYLDDEWTTIEQLGLVPDEYDDVPQTERYRGRNRLAAMESTCIYEQASLIDGYKNLFSKLDLDVVFVDTEGGEHYDYELPLELLRELNARHPDFAGDPISGLTLAREDRPKGYWYNSDFYTNGWGDMTIRLSVERESMTTTYSFVVFMDPNSPIYATNLKKYHAQTRRYDSVFKGEVAHFLATQKQDPITEQAGLNEVDGDEYDSLIKVVDTLAIIVDKH